MNNFVSGIKLVTKDLDENTILDLNPNGNICAITFEHASDRTDVQQITLEGIAA